MVEYLCECFQFSLQWTATHTTIAPMSVFIILLIEKNLALVTLREVRNFPRPPLMESTTSGSSSLAPLYKVTINNSTESVAVMLVDTAWNLVLQKLLLELWKQAMHMSIDESSISLQSMISCSIEAVQLPNNSACQSSRRECLSTSSMTSLTFIFPGFNLS